MVAFALEGCHSQSLDPSLFSQKKKTHTHSKKYLLSLSLPSLPPLLSQEQTKKNTSPAPPVPSALAIRVLRVAPARPRTQAHTAATQFTHADLGAPRFSRFRGTVTRKQSLQDASPGSESSPSSPGRFLGRRPSVLSTIARVRVTTEQKPTKKRRRKRHTQVQLCGGSWPHAFRAHSSETIAKMFNCTWAKKSHSQLHLRTQLKNKAHKFALAIWK